MDDHSRKAHFLQSFREIYDFFCGWVDELASRFDDRTALWKPHPTVNHALWLLGHITWILDALLVEVPTGKSNRNRDWDELFRIGSERFPEDRYPPFHEVLDHFRGVREKILRGLEEWGAEDLDKPCLQNTDWFPTPVVAMLSFLRDANYHLGQMSILHKLISAEKE